MSRTRHMAVPALRTAVHMDPVVRPAGTKQNRAMRRAEAKAKRKRGKR